MFSGKSFWFLLSRVLAGVFDWLLAFIPYILVLISVYFTYQNEPEKFASNETFYVLVIFFTLFLWFPIYYTFFGIFLRGFTIGKILYGLHLITDDYLYPDKNKRPPLSYRKVILREFFKGVTTSLFFGIIQILGASSVLYYFGKSDSDLIFWTQVDGNTEMSKAELLAKSLLPLIIIVVYLIAMLILRETLGFLG